MSLFSTMHSDKMDVIRHTEITVNGFTRSQETKVYEAVPCRLSRKSLVSTGSDFVPNISNAYTLFCAPDVDLKEGDKVVITKAGRLYSLKVGEIFNYRNTLQALVTRNETV